MIDPREHIIAAEKSMALLNYHLARFPSALAAHDRDLQDEIRAAAVAALESYFDATMAADFIITPPNGSAAKH